MHAGHIVDLLDLSTNDVARGGQLFFARSLWRRPLDHPEAAFLLARVSLAPTPERLQHRPQLATLGCQDIFGAWWVVFVKAANDDIRLLQSFQARRQRIGADARERTLEILKFPWPMKQEVAKDENAPTLTDKVEGARHRAIEFIPFGHFYVPRIDYDISSHYT
jgi:hypothetical protein